VFLLLERNNAINYFGTTLLFSFLIGQKKNRERKSKRENKKIMWVWERKLYWNCPTNIIYDKVSIDNMKDNEREIGVTVEITWSLSLSSQIRGDSKSGWGLQITVSLLHFTDAPNDRNKLSLCFFSLQYLSRSKLSPAKRTVRVVSASLSFEHYI